MMLNALRTLQICVFPVKRIDRVSKTINKNLLLDHFPQSFCIYAKFR